MSDESGGNEAHSFDRVFGDEIVDILVEKWAALDDEASGADARDSNTKLFEVETDILDHIIRGGADDGGFARCESGGHENVFSDSIAAFSKNDITIAVFVKSFLFDFDFIKTTMTFSIDGEPE